MRIMSVIGALALACLCLASPSIAAPADYMAVDAISLQSAPQLVADVAAPLELDMFAIVADADGSVDGNCAEAPAWVAIALPDGSLTAERLPACSPRRHDPGWHQG